MSKEDIKKIKANIPVSVILYGGRGLGFFLSQTLVSQGGKVVVIDEFNAKTKPYIDKLKKLGNVSFFDIKGLEDFYQKVGRIDYFIYLLDEHLHEKEVFTSKQFFAESKYLDQTLDTVKRFKSKFSLVGSLRLNKELAKQVQSVNASSPSPYSNIELQKYCETAVAEYTDKNGINARIIRLGTVMGRNIASVTDPDIDKLLLEATQKSSIDIEGEGLETHNIVHESDATYGILKMTFLDKTRGEVITLANKNDYTTLSLAYKALELNVDAQNIKFVEGDNLKPILQNLYVPAPNAGKFGWKQQISLEQSLMEQLQSYYEKENKSWNMSDQTKKELPTYTPTKTKTIVERTKAGKTVGKIKDFFEKIFGRKTSKEILTPKRIAVTSLVTIAVILFSFFILSPLIGIGLGTASVYSNTKEISSSLSSLDVETTSTKVGRIEKSLIRINQNLEKTHWIFKLVQKESLYNNATQLLLGIQYAIEGSGDMITSLQPLIEYFQEFEPALDFQSSTGSTTREYRTYLEELESNSYKIQDSAYKVELAFGIIDKVETSQFPKFTQEKILDLKDLSEQLYSTLEPLSEVSSFLPDLLGVDERKRYLVLLQNEGEIRSTGGWISSYAILGLEGGQIRELYVDDIYNADGMLSVQGKKFPAPRSMQEALSLENWSFSLVNWDPDLTNTMYSAEQFVAEMGKGDDIDGLITIDISLLQKLLDEWGGLEVAGETEIVTSSNLYSKIFEMHTSFTPGSSRKSTFLSNLADGAIKKILSSDISGYATIGEVVQESLDEKHLQMTFKNSDAFNYMDSHNWAGSLDVEYEGAPIAVDWNWGANKANLYIKKNHNLAITVKDENQLTFKYSLSIQNDSKKDNYPEGEYVNYLRIYLPLDAQILSIKGLEENEYDIYEENSLKVVGGWFNIPIQEVETFEISYKLRKDTGELHFPISVDGNNKELKLELFKQAGTNQDAYKVDVIYPSTWNAISAEGLNGLNNQLTGRFDLDKNIPVQITWGE
jgi:nucleoside-diphosphate-sugar epimerase